MNSVKSILDTHSSRGARLWLLMSVFLFSLGSHYFYNIGIYLFQIIGLIFSALLFRARFVRISNARLQLLIVFFLYAFGSGALSALTSGSNLIAPSKLLLPAFFVMWTIFAYVVFEGYEREFHWVLHKVIWIHVLVFFFQLIWFVITGDLIDFLEPITGETQRALGGSYESAIFSNFVRATGLYNEPGTYSIWMIILFLLFKNSSEKLNLENKYKILEVLVLASVFLSFSTFGFVFALIYISAAIFERKFKLTTLLGIGICLSPLVYLGFEIASQRMAMGAGESGVGFRMQALELYFSGLTPARFLFGLGMFSDYFYRVDTELVFQDVGLWFVIVSGVGVVGASLLALFLIFSVPRKVYSLLLLLILLMSKGSMTSAILWIVLLYFAISERQTPSEIISFK